MSGIRRLQGAGMPVPGGGPSPYAVGKVSKSSSKSIMSNSDYSGGTAVTAKYKMKLRNKR